MTLYPPATWRGPVPNSSHGFMHPARGLTLHVEVGTEAGTNSWFHDPAADASADFGVAFDGAVDQWVDCVGTDQKAWAQAHYNPWFYSLETEGQPQSPLTPAQIESSARLLLWLHQQDGFALQVTDDPNGRGLITHGAFGALGGGHLDCPGIIRANQRRDIVTRAIALSGVTPTPSEAHVALNKPACKILPTKTGNGYLIVAQDGGVFTFGDAGFKGSLGGRPVNAPIVDAAWTSTEQGYWLLGADGGVFTFGDAMYYGSAA